MRRTLVGFCASAFVFSVLGCSRQRAQTDALEVLVAAEPATLDPRYATRALDIKLSRLLHAGLVALDPDTLEPRPHLAESLVRRNDFDIEVTLRQGVRFHGGKRLEPSDVCATLNAVRDPALGSPHRSIVDTFVLCEAIDARHLLLRLGSARATWMSDLELPILRADQARIAPNANLDLDGLGPFRMQAHSEGNLLLIPAENGHGPRPRYSLEVRTIHDENARAMRIISGRAELCPNVFSPTLLAGFTNADSSIAVNTRPGANVTYLLIHNERPPFDRAEVRRGLSLAIDRDAIAKYLFAGKARPARWLVPEGHWAAPKGLVPLPYDPTAARALLSGSEAVTLLTSTDRSRVLQARAVAQMLSDAGLSTQVVPLELGLLFSRLDAGQFTLAILQIPELTEPNVLRWFFHPRGIGDRLEGKNRAFYRSQTAGELLDRASATFDQGSRAHIYMELAELMLTDMPVVPLWHEDQIVVARGRGRAFMPSADGRWSGLSAL